MTKNEFDLVRAFVYRFKELQKIAVSLHRLDINQCNYGLTPRQEKRMENLEKKANDIAKGFNLKAYHQDDPRGGTLYLIDDTMNQSNYHNGIFIA